MVENGELKVHGRKTLQQQLQLQQRLQALPQLEEPQTLAQPGELIDEGLCDARWAGIDRYLWRTDSPGP